MTSPNRKLASALASAIAIAAPEPQVRPPQRKVGSTNPNREAQKARRKARKKNR